VKNKVGLADSPEVLMMNGKAYQPVTVRGGYGFAAPRVGQALSTAEGRKLVIGQCGYETVNGVTYAVSDVVDHADRPKTPPAPPRKRTCPHCGKVI